jgi:hypothetical protein
MTSKQNLGQYYTTNYGYILQSLNIPIDIKHIVEPFAGQGDLIKFIKERSYTNDIECFDIDPKSDKYEIIQRDTLLSPPDFKQKFVITNPPYLARNKCKDKTYFDLYKENDLYKCFIRILIQNPCEGGILIVPLNFWTAIRKLDIKLRKDFLEKYDIVKLNIFEEPVFEDTNYTICSFQFTYKKEDINQKINTTIFPINKNLFLTLDKDNNYSIGGEIYRFKGLHKITRLTSKNIENCNTNLLLKCIDDSEKNQICLKYDTKHYVDTSPNLSARSYATLIIEPRIDENQQLELVKSFNLFMIEKRSTYHSLFLTNYRESNNGFARKRISFDLAYNIISYLLER